MVDFFRAVVGHEEERCGDCFRLRLSRTAEAAREMGFAAWGTTLLISPHQQHELLKETGEAVTKEKGVEFLYADLRKRYSESRGMTKSLDLYRQQYCGCLYSEWERYSGAKISGNRKEA
jgi:predicted adenine nucleotide alpha hydrolase (AANH) superfamily ATPase